MMNVTTVLSHAAQLWPNGKLTDAEVRAWRGSLSKIDVETEQALAVLDQVRVDRGRRSPPISYINKRLAGLMEIESRSKAAAEARVVPDANVDHRVPQGLVADAIREWRAAPEDERFIHWRENAKRQGMIEMMRRAWRVWVGCDGPYSREWYANDESRAAGGAA